MFLLDFLIDVLDYLAYFLIKKRSFPRSGEAPFFVRPGWVRKVRAVPHAARSFWRVASGDRPCSPLPAR